MKKMMVLVIAAVMVLAVAAAGKKSEPLCGAYEPAESRAVTEDVRALVEKATEGMVGAEYTPVAYLSRQIVAGTNHRILCEITPVVPDASPSYAVVTVYEDLEGNAEITEVRECDAEGNVFETANE